MKIVWTAQAVHDLDSILAYLEQTSGKAALALLEDTRHRVSHLEKFPLMGTPLSEIPDYVSLGVSLSEVSEVRALYPGDAMVIYLPSNREVTILRVFHQSQNRPAQ